MKKAELRPQPHPRGRTAAGTHPAELARLAFQEQAHTDCEPLKIQAMLWLYRAYNAANSVLGNQLRSTGLSLSGFNVLLALHNSPAQTLEPWQLAEELLVTRPSITGLLDTLQAKGLVQREPHREDGRRVLVRLTEQGRDVVDEMFPGHHASLQKLFDDLGDDDLDELVGLLRNVKGAAPPWLVDEDSQIDVR